MMKGLTVIFIFLLSFLPVSSGFETAQSLFNQKKYGEAAAAYKSLMTKYPDRTEEIQFNLAQCYLKVDSPQLALSLLHNLDKAESPDIRSAAFNTLGFLVMKEDKKMEALDYFRKALEVNPENEAARYNLEFILKKLGAEKKEETPEREEEEEEDDEMSAKDYRDKFNYYLPPKSAEGLPTLHHYDSIPIEKAMELLENLKEEEVKFLQQLKKVPKENQGVNQNTPQW